MARFCRAGGPCGSRPESCSHLCQGWPLQVQTCFGETGRGSCRPFPMAELHRAIQTWESQTEYTVATSAKVGLCRSRQAMGSLLEKAASPLPLPASIGQTTPGAPEHGNITPSAMDGLSSLFQYWHPQDLQDWVSCDPLPLPWLVFPRTTRQSNLCPHFNDQTPTIGQALKIQARESEPPSTMAGLPKTGTEDPGQKSCITLFHSCPSRGNNPYGTSL